jgi:hypothetical protein
MILFEARVSDVSNRRALPNHGSAGLFVRPDSGY